MWNWFFSIMGIGFFGERRWYVIRWWIFVTIRVWILSWVRSRFGGSMRRWMKFLVVIILVGSWAFIRFIILFCVIGSFSWIVSLVRLGMIIVIRSVSIRLRGMMGVIVVCMVGVIFGIVGMGFVTWSVIICWTILMMGIVVILRWLMCVRFVSILIYLRGKGLGFGVFCL